MKLQVAGAGHIGLVLASLLSRQHEVFCYDTDEAKIEMLRKGELPFYEPRLYVSGINFVTEPEPTAITFVCYGPPNLQQVPQFIRSVLKLSGVLILRGTMPPGTTEVIQRQRNELVFCMPERLVEGNAMEEEERLPKILGGAKGEIRDKIKIMLAKLGCPVNTVDDYAVAEICKLVDNANRFLQINFANEIGELCSIYGADSHEVVRLCNKGYHRNHIMIPGLGGYGPCLIKDTLMFAGVSNHADLTLSALGRNDRPLGAICDIITECGYKKVAILGLAYKGDPPTSDTRDSPSEWILKRLHCDDISTYDPVNSEGTWEDAVWGVDAVVVLTNHKELSEITREDIEAVAPGAVIFDPCGVIK